MEQIEAERGRLQLSRTAQQRGQLGRAQLSACEEVARQGEECTFRLVSLRVLTWNLKHGRAVPSAGRDLFNEFCAALAGWEWEVALLQEVPPWWPGELGARLGAQQRMVLTSRNFGLAARRALAIRWPDAIKSNGGGCNAVLVRGGAGIVEHRTLRLTRLPERRWLLGVRLTSGLWVGTLHLTGGNESAAAREGRAAADAMLAWASGPGPVVLGGDFNLNALTLPGFALAGGFQVDHVFAHGLDVVAGPHVLDRGQLSDHAPVLVSLAVS
jgi:endonuclease/exonuclease/phosphatase family metal-dependent hydrolase